MIYNSPRGTEDYFGEEIKYRDFLTETSRSLFKIFNYSEIITPHFEHTEVFSRGIGENSEIVQKEMYTFSDKKNRSLTLRPEGTASVVRAIVENKLYSGNLPLKLFYIGSMFRYERPQKGRMREFCQIGVESAGSDSPSIDADVIWLLYELFRKLGFRNLTLYVNSIGCADCRAEYVKMLEDQLIPVKDSLCQDCNSRLGKNTLRIFDCKVKTCREVLKNVVKISDNLCENCLKHFNEIKSLMDVLEVDYVHNKNLVRGFDYYTRTIFEIISSDINSAQNALGGGGRYDNLIKEFGGPEISSVGFAIGLERTVLLMKELGIKLPDSMKFLNKTYIINMDSVYDKYVFELLRYLRSRDIYCDTNFNIKSVGKEIKFAQNNGYENVIIVGEDEYRRKSVKIKNLKKYSQKEFEWDSEKEKILNFLKKTE
ncbi:MAG TPA: histidine--tRNA ligase [Actinobacteria bacterium]|nr:histidine--tRNA ligase [Actinomycetota bacterium]